MDYHDLVKQFLIEKGFAPDNWQHFYSVQVDLSNPLIVPTHHKYTLWVGGVNLHVYGDGRLVIEGLAEFDLDVMLHNPESLELLEDMIYKLYIFLGKIVGEEASRDRFYASKRSSS